MLQLFAFGDPQGGRDSYSDAYSPAESLYCRKIVDTIAGMLELGKPFLLGKSWL
jgi:hypothetical protein